MAVETRRNKQLLQPPLSSSAGLGVDLGKSFSSTRLKLAVVAAVRLLK